MALKLDIPKKFRETEPDADVELQAVQRMTAAQGPTTTYWQVLETYPEMFAHWSTLQSELGEYDKEGSISSTTRVVVLATSVSQTI